MEGKIKKKQKYVQAKRDSRSTFQYCSIRQGNGKVNLK